jgi:hypothetical protein
MPAFVIPGWYPDPDKQENVRHWNGRVWSSSMSVEMAQLTELSKLNSRDGKLHKIAFRVGFLALLALLAILVSLAGLLAIPLAVLG